MKLRKYFIFLIIFLSGYSALVYQVAWERLLKFQFGGDIISSSIITSVFLLGIGIGSYLFRQQTYRPLLTYSILEILLGFFAIISFCFIGELSGLSSNFSESFHYLDFDISKIIFVISFLFIPTIIFGATFPIYISIYKTYVSRSDIPISIIYCINVLGGAIGIVFVPLLFLNSFDFDSVLFFHGFINITIGLITLLISVVLKSDLTETLNEKNRIDFNYFFLALTTGISTIGIEIILFRVLGITKSMSPYIFPIVLFFFLTGIAFGSLVFGSSSKNYIDVIERRIKSLIYTSIFLISTIFIVKTYLMKPSYNSDGFFPWIFYAALISFPFAFSIGSILPNVIRLNALKHQNPVYSSGYLYLSSAVGSFIIGISIPFLILPSVGSKGIFLIILAFLIFSIAILKGNRKSKIIAFTFILGLSFLLNKLDWGKFNTGFNKKSLDFVEGPSGIAYFHWINDSGQLYINGIPMASLPKNDKHDQLESIARKFKVLDSTLLIGVGAGTIVEGLIKNSDVIKIDLIDWSRELPLLIEMERPSQYVKLPYTSKKFGKWYFGDARNEISLMQSKSYDLIIDNVSVLGWSGSTSVKSTEYVKEIKRILKDGGSYLAGSNYKGSPYREALLRTLQSHFIYVYENQDLKQFIASNQKISDSMKETIELKDIKRFCLIEDGSIIDELEIFDNFLGFEYSLSGKIWDLNKIQALNPIKNCSD